MPGIKRVVDHGEIPPDVDDGNGNEGNNEGNQAPVANGFEYLL